MKIQKNIQDLITPKERKRISNWKKLSDEDLFILKKRGQIISSFFVGFFLYAIFYFPIQFFDILIKKHALFFSIIRTTLLLFNIYLFSAIFGAIMFGFFYLIDKYFEYNYFQKGTKILKKLRGYKR